MMRTPRVQRGSTPICQFLAALSPTLQEKPALGDVSTISFGQFFGGSMFAVPMPHGAAFIA